VAPERHELYPQRVIENVGGFVEGDSVLGEVAIVLVRIPVKL
jgi:hypothetical protein